MSIYIARVIDTKKLVCVFEARTETEIFWSIDRIDDPYACEYTKVRGLFIGCPGGTPAFDPDGEGAEEVFDGAEIDLGALFGNKWLPAGKLSPKNRAKA